MNERGGKKRRKRWEGMKKYLFIRGGLTEETLECERRDSLL